MPKFSAYMKGGDGPAGPPGGSIIDGIVESAGILPRPPQNDKKAYLVGIEDPKQLYVWNPDAKDGEGDWENQGYIAEKLGNVSASITAIPWAPDVSPSVSTQFSTSNQIDYLTFDFTIPDAQPAGFGNISITTNRLSYTTPPTASVTASGENYAKNFNFSFGIPEGTPGGFSTNQTATATTLAWDANPTVSVTPKSNTPNDSKSFNFAFGIPEGRAAGFGEITSEIESIPFASTTTKKDSIVSFSTDYDYAIEEAVVDIEPIQDLHGYDHPWPAGGGKNLLPNNVVSQTINGVTYTINSDGTVLANGTASGLANLQIYSGILETGIYTFSSGITETQGILDSLVMSGETIITRGNSTFSLAEDTEIKVILRVNDTTANNVLFKPMIRLAYETDDTYEPYSNICPITGWTGANVYRTGINIWDKEWEVGAISWATGAPISSEGYVRSKNIIPVKPNTTYFIKTILGTYSINIFYYDKTDSLIDKTNSTINNTFTTPSLCDHIRFRCQTMIDISNDISINYPSTDTNYHAYTGTTYSITFPSEAGTVYGGTLDVTKGTLTANIALVYLKNLTWTPHNTLEHIFNSSIPNRIKGTYNRYNNGLNISNCYKLRNSSVSDQEGISNCINGFAFSNSNSSDTIYIKDSRATTVSEMLQLFTEENSYIIYELAEPIVYNISSTKIASFLGQNNIWADIGDISISYGDANQPNVEVTVDENSPEYAKEFDFNFQIPVGRPAGFGNINVTTSTLIPTENAWVNVESDGNSPEYAKNFNFEFGIPQGYAAGFSTKQHVSVSTLDAGLPAEVTITAVTSSPETAKEFNFHFGLPKGDTLAIYDGVHFTTGDGDDYHWENNKLIFNRGNSQKIPIYIYNKDNDSIINTFELNDTTIEYDAYSRFNGIMYLMMPALLQEIDVGSVTTVPWDEDLVIKRSERSSSTKTLIDFEIPESYPGRDIIDSMTTKLESVSTKLESVSTELENYLPLNGGTINGTLILSKTTDASGIKDNGPALIIGGTRTDAHIEIDGNEIVAKNNATTGGVLSLNYDGGGTVQIGSGGLTIGTPLTVANGGTGRTSLTTNAVLTGNGISAVNNVATENGAFYATTTNGAPQFGTLPVKQGGTGLIASPSMLTSLGSTTAANILVAKPRPGVTGILPIANGGTGVGAGVNVDANTVFAGQYSSVAGQPSFRKLVAGDLPLISLTNKVDGTLPIANGGTNTSTTTGILQAILQRDITTNATHVFGFKSGTNWATAGYLSMADLASKVAPSISSFTASLPFSKNTNTKTSDAISKLSDSHWKVTNISFNNNTAIHAYKVDWTINNTNKTISLTLDKKVTQAVTATITFSYIL